MMHVGLLGWPVSHSVSPAMHNAAFRAAGIDGYYGLYAVEPTALEARVVQALEEGISGFNVTVPHKRAVLALPQVTSHSDAVATIGAANTLVKKKDGTLHAENTDWSGLLADLKAHEVPLSGTEVLILGTGGSAKAVAYAAHQARANRVTFVSRSPQHDVIGYGDLDGLQADVIVNCTPVGMYPQVDASPWPDSSPLPEGAVIYDLIYNPPVTALMAAARAQGLKAIGGLGMLARQGAESFLLWTGVPPNIDIMTHAAKDALHNGRHNADQS